MRTQRQGRGICFLSLGLSENCRVEVAREWEIECHGVRGVSRGMKKDKVKVKGADRLRDFDYYFDYFDCR